MTDVKWCPRILPLQRDRRMARIESALVFSLTLNMSPLRRIKDVASKTLVPLGMISSLESDNRSSASSVAFADLRFSWARCSMMLTFSRLVRSLAATCVWVKPVALRRMTCHCLAVSIVLGDLNLVNCLHRKDRTGECNHFCLPRLMTFPPMSAEVWISASSGFGTEGYSSSPS
jgi:hypothetical protein